MDALFTELISTLEEAHRAVQVDLARLLHGAPLDRPALARLAEAVQEFARQADSVFVRMIECDASESLMDRAEALVDQFQDVAQRIGARLPSEHQ